MKLGPGGLHRRPSELVDKILKTLRDREREFHRTNSIISNGCHSIPSRFKVMDPNRTTFDSVVRRVAEKERHKANAFRSLARSVLSKENRTWRQEQIREKNNTVIVIKYTNHKDYIARFYSRKPNNY